MSKRHPVDIHVGARLRQRRSLLGMTRADLASLVGLKFPQIQRYEEGRHRVSASRLFEFATILDVPVSYFFDEISASAALRRKMGKGFRQEDTFLRRAETFKLVRAYYKIRHAATRRRICEMVIALGEANPTRPRRARKRP